LNLQAGGSSLCWYSLTYNWSEYDQFIKRLDRVGQTEMVTVTRLMATETIDYDIDAVLHSRGTDDATLFNQLRTNHGNAKHR
jgi:SNF2 family DNA or RNA helicase